MRDTYRNYSRAAESQAVIQAQGEGCAFCIDGAKSCKEATQIDICRELFVYLPILMDINNQRPSWCPGFACNGTGLALGPLSLKDEETEQQELPL